MWRSKIAAIALVATLFATSLSAQVYLNEDWSTASGLVPPTGWSSKIINYSGGYTAAPWRFDNPGARTPAAPFAGLFAISDPDQAGFAVFPIGGTSILRSPAFNATGTSALNLDFDQQLRDLTSGWWIDVFDGSMWNTVAFQANNTVNMDIGWSAGTPSGVVSTQYDITAAAAGSMTAQVRFVYQYAYDWWWAIDNVRVSQPAPIDMKLVSIDSPVDNPLGCIPVLGNQTVSVTIENKGSAVVPAMTAIQMDYDVNGGPVNTEFLILPAPLNPNATTTFTFATPANLPSPGPNNITATVTLVGDADPTNDSVTENYGGGASLSTVTLPFFENFDSTTTNNTLTPPMGWQQDTADAIGADSDWHFYSGVTSSFNTGPANGDHTTGSSYYAYVEDSGAAYTAVNLISPCIDLQTATAPIAQFWMHSWNYYQPLYENFLSVDVIAYPGGATTLDAFGPVGHQQTAPGLPGTSGAWNLSQWTQQTINLTPYVGQVVQLRFRVNANGGSTNHDIAIDDVSVFEPMPTPGQAPRTGLAAFDINGALNINNANVASGLGGPYYASVTQGGAMNMSFDGNPNQPIAVVYGTLNPVSASYPGGIGQFDVGGPGVDPNGIPLNLGVFVNAIGWAQGGFVGLPLDSLFFTSATGLVSVGFTFPNFGIPMGSVLTTFQSAITAPAAPFVYLSNAIQVTVN